jgi:hypothetical protein
MEDTRCHHPVGALGRVVMRDMATNDVISLKVMDVRVEFTRTSACRRQVQRMP